MTTQQNAPPCPTPQTLVRFAEGRLRPEEIAPVLAHLDTCEDCTAAVEMANDVVRETREGKVRPHASRWAIGFAAAAAAGAVVFFLMRAPQQSDGMARLVALAPQTERLIEPRLSAPFQWAAYRGPARAGATVDAQRMKLIGAAGEAAERANRDSSTEAQQVAGVAMLLADQPLEAERVLQNAVELSPRNAKAWSDLGAARYTSAQRLGRPSLYPEALAATDAALRIEPRLAEAAFNRALILERLSLRDEARAAWERYLEIDSSSPWAVEARTHLTAPPGADAGARFRRDLEELERAVAARNVARVGEIVRAHPQQCRSWGEGDYLGRWGQAELRGDLATAQRLLAVARAIGDALAAINGELLLRDSVAAIDAAGHARATLAGAYARYWQGRTLYARQEPAAAEGHLRHAARGFEQAGSPMARVARYFAANTTFDRQIIAAARAELMALLADVPPGHDALAAQIRWQLGLCAMFDGNWPDALTQLRRSEGIFLRAGEAVNAANVRSLLATTLTVMGRPDEAWTSRIAAFEALRGNRERLLVAVGGAARMELRGMRRLRSALAGRAFIGNWPPRTWVALPSSAACSKPCFSVSIAIWAITSASFWAK